MPQLNKGGKFVFGLSRIQADGTLRFPPQAVAEYDVASERKVYLFTGSKSTGGFCVTRRGLLEPSKLSHILRDNPTLRDYTAREGEFVRYKGRAYCWTSVGKEGTIRLSGEMLGLLKIAPDDELLCIRSSDIAFTMGARGPLLEKSAQYEGTIEVY